MIDWMIREMRYDENNICRMQSEKDLKIMPGSDCVLDTLAIDEPLEYTRLYLNENLQMWVYAEDSLEIFWFLNKYNSLNHY